MREVLPALGGAEEVEDVDLLPRLEADVAGRPGAAGDDDVGVALSLELGHGAHLDARLGLGAVREAELDVAVDILVGDAERRDDVARDAAEGLAALEDGHVGAGAREEERAGQAGRAAADDGDLAGLGARDLLRAGAVLDAGEKRVDAAARRRELARADGRALGLVERAHALGAAGVRAEIAGNEGQGVSLRDDGEGVVQATLVDGGQVGGDVLLDGAAVAAGRGEAAGEGQRPVELVRRERLHGLLVLGRGGDGLIERGDGLDVHVLLARGALEQARDLAEALVAAGLENRGGHGDGPDARAVNVADVLGVGAAGVADAQLAVELLGDAMREMDGQREERAAAHVHLLARQLLARDVDREGVRELDAEGEAALGGEGDEAAEHRHGVDPLQVLAEVLVVEGDVVEAEGIEATAGVVVAEQGRVALDVGVQALLANEIGRDALDLVGRAAMEGGLRHGRRDMRAHGVNEGLVNVGKSTEVLAGPRVALRPDGRAARVLHVLDVGVDLGALDALEVVADAHVEDEAVGVAQPELAGDELAGPPGLDVLVLRLGHGQLGRPLAVVALVLGNDAGLGHALRELLAVHDLDGLELEEARAGHVGGNDVLRELAVRAGGRAEGRLDLLGEDGLGAALVAVGLADAEDRALLGVLGQDPVHKLGKRNGPHDVAHKRFLSCRAKTAWPGGFVPRPPTRRLRPRGGREKHMLRSQEAQCRAGKRTDARHLAWVLANTRDRSACPRASWTAPWSTR